MQHSCATRCCFPFQIAHFLPLDGFWQADEDRVRSMSVCLGVSLGAGHIENVLKLYLKCALRVGRQTELGQSKLRGPISLVCEKAAPARAFRTEITWQRCCGTGTWEHGQICGTDAADAASGFAKWTPPPLSICEQVIVWQTQRFIRGKLSSWRVLELILDIHNCSMNRGWKQEQRLEVFSICKINFHSLCSPTPF